MKPSDGERQFSWSKASMITISVSLGILLLCGLRGIGSAKDSVDGLLGALQIVAFPGALVFIILGPYIIVRSGEEWVEKRQTEASFLAESAQTPHLSLLRSSASYAVPEEMLRATLETGDRDPQQLLRVLTDGETETERC